MLRVFLALGLPAAALALENGLGLTPQMGYSSWNDCGSVVTEAHIKATAGTAPPARQRSSSPSPACRSSSVPRCQPFAELLR